MQHTFCSSLLQRHVPESANCMRLQVETVRLTSEVGWFVSTSGRSKTYLFTFQGAIHSQPGLLSLCGVCLSSKPTCQPQMFIWVHHWEWNGRCELALHHRRVNYFRWSNFPRTRHPAISHQPIAMSTFRSVQISVGLWRYSRGAWKKCSFVVSCCVVSVLVMSSVLRLFSLHVVCTLVL